MFLVFVLSSRGSRFSSSSSSLCSSFHSRSRDDDTSAVREMFLAGVLVVPLENACRDANELDRKCRTSPRHFIGWKYGQVPRMESELLGAGQG